MTTFSQLSQYGIDFQIKVISSLLTNKTLLINIRDSVDEELFNNDSHKWIVGTTLKYFDKYHTIPTIEVLSIEVKKLKDDILQIAVTEQLREAYKASEEDLRYVEEEFSNFCLNQQVKKAIMTSVDLLNIGDYEGIKSLISKALKGTEEKNLGHIYEKDVETRYREDDRRPIPFPWKAFNDITQGGYGRGELILIFGNPKGGKSWVAIAMAAYAVALGHNVVYYTLELSDSYVGRRFDAIFTQIAVEALKDNRSKIDEMVASLKGKLRIKEFIAGRTTLDHVDTHLDQLEQQEGFKADVIFADYLDLFKNRNTFRKEKREDIDDVYTDARGMARERQVPFVSPSQINRAGANDSIIEADKIAGSYGKIMIGDFVFSLSRKKADKKAGVARFHIMGNRLGPDGLTYFAKMDTSKGYININDNPISDDEEDGFDEEKRNDKYPKKSNFNDTDNLDKKKLNEKFFQLQNG